MFVMLLAVTFVIAVAVSFLVGRVFRRPIESILKRIIQDDISIAWVRYLKFALYVVGVSAGVRFWDLEKYITPGQKDGQVLVLDTNRWVLEIYKTIIGTLQGVAWMLLVFFLFAMIAYVVVKFSESRKAKAG